MFKLFYYLWKRVEWIVLPLVMIGSLFSVYIVAIFEELPASISTLIDARFVASETLRLVLASAIVGLICRLLFTLCRILVKPRKHSNVIRKIASDQFYVTTAACFLAAAFLCYFSVTRFFLSAHTLSIWLVFVLALKVFFVSIGVMIAKPARESKSVAAKYIAVLRRIWLKPGNFFDEHRSMGTLLMLLLLVAVYELGDARFGTLIGQAPVYVKVEDREIAELRVFGATESGVLFIKPGFQDVFLGSISTSAIVYYPNEEIEFIAGGIGE